MNFSLVRTDEKHICHLTLKSLESFVERIKTDTKNGMIGRLRRFILDNGERQGYDLDTEIPKVCPSVELRLSDNGSLLPVVYNSVVTLHVGGLLRQEDIEVVKNTARMMPMTLAAFAGADGRSVELLVAVRQQDGALPTGEHEADMFYRAAYEVAFAAYSGVLPKPIERQTVSSRSGFRLPLDPQPYFNTAAMPLLIAPQSGILEPKPADTLWQDDEEPQQQSADARLYADYERMYARAARAAHAESADVIASQRYEAYLTELARQLCEMAVPEDETLLHIMQHHRSDSSYDEETLRAIVEAVYSEYKPKRQTEEQSVSQTTRRLINYLQTHYVFRQNMVMGYSECRRNNSWDSDWVVCDEKLINGLTIEVRLADIDARDKDVRRYVHSNLLKNYDPVSEYLWGVFGKWDGKTDHIAQLARTVPCNVPQWERWFRKWLLAMVAQWIGRSRNYGNSLVPLLISDQGDGKSQFCQRLLPPELSWGYQQNLLISEKAKVLQAMHQMLLINLDEFNQVSAAVQQGFLKNVIQLPSVKIKRPYGRHVEEFPRRASFIATTNERSVLADPTGNRRFIGIELSGPLDTNYHINYQQLYAQAMHLVVNAKERYWLDADETQELMDHNQQFQQLPPAVQFFRDCYDTPSDEQDGQWLSPTAVYQRLRKLVGSGLQVNGVNNFGRFLANLPGIQQRRTRSGRLYLVREKK